jgi:hypothetical protein
MKILQRNLNYPLYVSSNSVGCNSNLEKPHWPN